MADDLGTISVGLRVNMTGLNTDIENARRKVAGVGGQHRVSFVVGTVDTTKAQAQIDRILKRRFVITPTLSVSGESARGLRNDIAAKLKTEPVPVAVTLDPSSVAPLRNAIQEALRGLPIAPGGGTGGGGAPATRSRRAQAPVEAAVAAPVAPGVASALAVAP